MSIADSLLRAGKAGISKRGRPSSLDVAIQAKKSRGATVPIPNKSVRLNGVHHWPEYGKKSRCKFPGCTGYTKVICSKCKLKLCFTVNSNCYKNFHTN